MVGWGGNMEVKFIVDTNVGKLAKWLRIMGYDTLFIKGIDDNELVRIAVKEERVVLTKDTQIMRRRIVSEGKVQVVLLKDDDVKAQLHQVVQTLQLDPWPKAFSLCLECNQVLVPREKADIRELVPPYVFQTQSQYMQCPSCHRIYWRGTHWQRMKRELEKLPERLSEESGFHL
jgi:hypothetical protein